VDFRRESWRKLYLRENLDQQGWPLFARGLRDLLIRLARDDGTLIAHTSAPADDLASTLKADEAEAPQAVVAAGLMLEDGYLSHERGRLFITRFEEGQDRNVSTPRVRKHRAKLPESTKGETFPEHVTKQSGETDPTRPDTTRPNTPTVGDELPQLTPAPVKRKAKALPKRPKPVAIAWRVWRELYGAKHNSAYVNAHGDGQAMKQIAALAVEHSDGREGDQDVVTESVLRHWFAAYLADAGHKGHLAAERHPIRCASRDLNKYGLPWSGAPVDGEDVAIARRRDNQAAQERAQRKRDAEDAGKAASPAEAKQLMAPFLKQGGKL